MNGLTEVKDSYRLDPTAGASGMAMAMVTGTLPPSSSSAASPASQVSFSMAEPPSPAKAEEKPKRIYKRFRNSFIYFVNDRRKRRTVDELAIGHREFISRMGEEWKKLDDDEKRPFVLMAEEDRKRYEDDVKKYGKIPANPPRESTSSQADNAPAKGGGHTRDASMGSTMVGNMSAPFALYNGVGNLGHMSGFGMAHPYMKMMPMAGNMMMHSVPRQSMVAGHPPPTPPEFGHYPYRPDLAVASQPWPYQTPPASDSGYTASNASSALRFANGSGQMPYSDTARRPPAANRPYPLVDSTDVNAHPFNHTMTTLPQAAANGTTVDAMQRRPMVAGMGPLHHTQPQNMTSHYGYGLPSHSLPPTSSATMPWYPEAHYSPLPSPNRSTSSTATSTSQDRAAHEDPSPANSDHHPSMQQHPSTLGWNANGTSYNFTNSSTNDVAPVDLENQIDMFIQNSITTL
ncbi:hypothetical protein H4R35_005358 [Dimargaris xerosporica]|nr:hypothetical protein H4R35_005358 [Dimargaris xerosporica]